MLAFFSRRMALLFLVTFLYMSSIMMLGPVIVGFCASLGGGAVLMGIAGGLSNFSSLLCRPFLGRFIDRLDHQRTSMAGLGCMGTGALICALTPDVWLLLLGRIFTGIGFAVSSATLSTWVAASLPSDQVGRGMGFYGVCQAIAQAISPTFGLRLAGMMNPRLTFITASILAFGGCLLTSFLRDDQRAAFQQPEEPTRFFLPSLLPTALIVLFFCTPYNGVSSFLATVAKDRQLSFGVGTFFTIYALFLFGVRFLLKNLLDRISFRRSCLMCVPFGVASMLCLQWMRSWWLLVLSALLMTFAYGMIQPICQTACIKSVSPEQRGLANCTYYIGLDAGLAFGPVLAGALYQAVGEEGLFYTLACIPLLSIPVLSLSRQR